ncbi:MAG: hypothetical protein ACX93O_08525 [Flagellimonas sp.]
MRKDLKDRTKAFAITTWNLCSNIPKSREFNAFISRDNLAEMKALHTEASEILAIIVSSIKTARSNGK